MAADGEARVGVLLQDGRVAVTVGSIPEPPSPTTAEVNVQASLSLALLPHTKDERAVTVARLHFVGAEESSGTWHARVSNAYYPCWIQKVCPTLPVVLFWFFGLMWLHSVSVGLSSICHCSHSASSFPPFFSSLHFSPLLSFWFSLSSCHSLAFLCLALPVCFLSYSFALIDSLRFSPTFFLLFLSSSRCVPFSPSLSQNTTHATYRPHTRCT